MGYVEGERGASAIVENKKTPVDEAPGSPKLTRDF